MNAPVYLLTENNPVYEAGLAQWIADGGELTDCPDRAEVILTAPPLLAASPVEFPQLKWVQSTYAGVDALLQRPMFKQVLLTNVRGIFGQQMAEYVMGLGLYHSRQMSQYSMLQHQGQWQPKAYQTVLGQRLVIFGTGSIGQHLARVAHAFGLHVIGVNRSGETPAESVFDEVIRLPQKTAAHWDDFASGVLGRAHWMVNTLPATPDTLALFDQTIFGACQGVLFFNVGRGASVHEADLLTALGQGGVEHAFLDVFECEPLPAASLFWAHPRVTVTPHIAAPSVPEQVLNVFEANYRRFIAGEPLHHVVDPVRGY